MKYLVGAVWSVYSYMQYHWGGMADRLSVGIKVVTSRFVPC